MPICPSWGKRYLSVCKPLALLLTSTCCFGAAAPAVNQAVAPISSARAVEPVNETATVQLSGAVHPGVNVAVDEGTLPDSFALNHVMLQLRRSPEQQQALDTIQAQLHDPTSPNYHKWLTADQFRSYGAAQGDVDTVVQWLTTHGMTVNAIHKNGLTIDFSTTAGQVREAFHTEMHQYNLNGEEHVANATNPSIPAALAPVIAGFVSLHNFMPKPALIKPKTKTAFTFPCTNCPDGFDGAVLYDEAPADFATIYNVAPLYQAKHPITGKGQTVVVLEVTDIKSADVKTFRTAFGLSKYAGTFTQIHPGPGCTDPGVNSAEGEAALDSEWAGAIAPDAKVELASCADSTTNFGAFIAAQNLLDEATPPPIMSLSYLECEAGQGPAGNVYLNDLWEQADLEGVSVFVAAGDNGSAGCDDFDTAGWATTGIEANSLASTPYNVATGGTDFLDTYLNATSQYWNTTNGTSGGSAISYIPETPWNDSCAGSALYTYFGYSDGVTFCNSTIGSNFLNIIAGSGAASFFYAKPYWQQSVAGIPNDGARDLPDISLFASNGFWNHSILFCMSDSKQGGHPCDYTNPVDTFYNSAGGTSFTAPQFASIQALINQRAGAPQGNPDPVFYDLARKEYGTSSSHSNSCGSMQGSATPSSCVFHDVTFGNNDVPCYGPNNCYPFSALDYGVLSTSTTSLSPAFPAHVGWDFATGLGTVNVANLVNAWP